MILKDEETGKKYRRFRPGEIRGEAFLVVEVPEKKTFWWGDVMAGVLVKSICSDEVWLLDDREMDSPLRFSDKWQVWRGGNKCPLPKGVMIEAIYRNGDRSSPIVSALTHSWIHACYTDIIAFRVIGLEEGCVYPDELENES